MEKTIASKIKELRERNNFSLQELADYVGVAKQSIHKFENGLVRPSNSTLVKIANAFNVSFAYFFENTTQFSICFQNIKFREKHKVNNEFLETEIKDELCSYLSRYLELETIMNERQSFENPLSGFEILSEKDIEKAAKIIRKKWKIGFAPIADVVETLESNGVFVFEVKRIEDFTGLSGIVNDIIPIIILNENCPTIERRRFTALHELGHIVLEFSETLSEKKIERLCDTFAGAVLIVDEMLNNEIGKGRTVISLAELKRIKELYGISIKAIIMRARSINLISYETSQIWWKSYEEWNLNIPNSADFGNYNSTEKTSRFKSLIVRGINENRISLSKGAELYGRKIDLFKKELDELKFNLN